MKTFNALLVAAVVAGSPALAMGDCGYGKAQQTTMSCAPGTTLDAASGKCVAEATS